jgi:hypothetical protein
MNAWGIGGSWQPQDSGWIPSISAGYGYNTVDAKNDAESHSKSVLDCGWNGATFSSKGIMQEWQ